MIDLERLYGYKHEFEREEFEIKAQIAELERRTLFVRAEISVVERMIADEECCCGKCVPEYAPTADANTIESDEEENMGVELNNDYAPTTEEQNY